MGINGSVCCYNRTNIPNSEVKVSDDLTANRQNSKESEILKDIKNIKDISLGFDYILSGDYYLMLFKVTSYYHLIDKMVLELNSDDIFVLIENIINWIKKTESLDNKIINEAKLNIEYGTKKIIHDINIYHSQNKTKIPKIFSIKCLGDLSIIGQYIKFKNNNGKDNKYEKSFWKEGEEVKQIKKNSYKISYNLMKIRDNVSNPSCYQSENKDNNTESDIEKLNSLSNESSKLYNNIEKFINEINDSLFN